MKKTIPKNRAHQIVEKIISAKAFTLDNGFSGRPVEELEWLKAHLTRDGSRAKITYDKETRQGRAVLHSNAWYEFEITPAMVATRPGDEAAIYAEENGVDYATALVRCNMD